MARAKAAGNRRIVVVADVSGIGRHYHLGDEAMCDVAIARLAKIAGRANITLLCTNAMSASKTYDIRAVRISRLRLSRLGYRIVADPFRAVPDLIKLIWHLRKSDLVFFAGGGNLTDLYPKALESRMFVLRLAQLLHKPVVLASQTIGPLSQRSKARLRPLLERACYIGVRDPSFSACQIDLPVHFAPDDAVFIDCQQGPYDDYIGAIGMTIHPHRLAGQQVGPLLDHIARLVRMSRKKAVFIPHLSPVDLPVGHRLRELLADDLKVLTEPPMPEQMIGICKAIECMISTRYHGVVFALATGRPVVGIYCDDYSKAKIDGAYAQFGLPSYAIGMGHPDMLPEAVGKAVMDAAIFRQASEATRSNGIKASLAPYRMAEHILNGGQVR